MRILLVSSPIPEPTRWGRKLRDVRPVYMPLGLAMIAGVAERRGAEVRVVDCNVTPFREVEFAAMLREFRPDIVGIQVLIMSYGGSKPIARVVKETLPEALVALGGPHATESGEAMLRDCPHFDVIVIGEGEATFEELMDAVADGSGPGAVAGLAWRDGADVRTSAARPFIPDIDALPYPARHLFPTDGYRYSPLLRGNNIFDLVTARGCPFRCTFCHTKALPRFRMHSVERVISEIKMLRDTWHADALYFHDDVLTVNRRRTMELCDRMIDERLVVPWSCLTHVAVVDRELLEHMKAAGCYQIWFGIESGVQRLLDFVQKDFQLEQAVQALRHCNDAGIMAHTLFILGLPTETPEESEQTIRFAIKLDPCFAQFSLATPLRGTRMYEQMLDPSMGTIIDADESHYDVFTNAVFVAKGRTVEELRALHRRAYRRFYLRPRYVAKILPHLMRYPLKSLYAFAKTSVKQLILH
jgi:anaerobic magnesium-protoporphyrin IX monomethyl ester cyclase